MRLLIAVCIFCWLTPTNARAQFMREHEGEGGVRGFHVNGETRVKRSFQSDAEAAAEFNRILAAIGLSWIADRITLRASDETPNAEAGINSKGERFIFYNALFMQKVKQQTAEHWSLVSILAHEIGHHLAFHTEIEGRWHEFEFEADYFSGFVLRKLGASLDQSHAAMKAISPIDATKTHPGLGQRLQVITIGWTDAGTNATPRGLKQAQQDQAKLEAGAAGKVPGEANTKETGDEAATAEAERAKQQQLAMLAEQEKRRAETERTAKEEAERKAKEDTERVSSENTFRDCAEKDTSGNFICPEMVVIPTGQFLMGSATNEEGFDSDEGPQRKVTIAKPFAVGKFEVTFAEWDACVAARGCNTKPEDENWGRGRRPVINISWDDAKEYVAWLSRKTDRDYRLLSEAEWEYAARAKTVGSFSFDGKLTARKANYKGAHHKKTVDVGSFQPNRFGLHDVHGNVGEWVEDCYHDTYKGAPIDGSAWRTSCYAVFPVRVLRGGDWDASSKGIRSASRGWGSRDLESNQCGFRVGRTLER